MDIIQKLLTDFVQGVIVGLLLALVFAILIAGWGVTA